MFSFLHTSTTRSVTLSSGKESRFQPAIHPLEDRLAPVLDFTPDFYNPLTFHKQTVSLATGDFDGDGRPDIASVGYETDTVSILRNNTSTVSPVAKFDNIQIDYISRTFSVGAGPFDIVVADFNRDGRADFATADRKASVLGGGTVTVSVNATPPRFEGFLFANGKSFVTGNLPTRLALGDFDGDGRTDLAVTINSGTVVQVFRNTTSLGSQDASFAPSQSFVVGPVPTGIAVGDFDRDGRDDIAVTINGSNTVSVLRNTTANGATLFSFAAAQSFGVANTPRDVAVGDFDGDGRADLAVVNGSNATVSVLRNITASSTITFAGQVVINIGAEASNVEVADYDGDGRVDLAVPRSDNKLAVFLNSTSVGAAVPTFTAPQTFGGPIPIGLSNPAGLVATDLNGDGRIDLAIGSGDTLNGPVFVLNNATSSVYTSSPSWVAQLGNTGVWAYNRFLGQWGQTTSSNADALAVAPNGNAVGIFGAFGVYYYRPLVGWSQINGIRATAVAIDRYGNPYASFAGIGTAVFRRHNNFWEILPGTAAAADKLVVAANGDVFANFNPFGVYRYRPTTGWVQINGYTANTLAVDASGWLVASFTGFGVGQYIPYAAGWRVIAPATTAVALAVDGYGNVFASAPSAGVSRWSAHTATWSNLSLNATASTLAADWYGNVFAAFTGFGVWEYNPSHGWRQQRSTDSPFFGLG